MLDKDQEIWYLNKQELRTLDNVLLQEEFGWLCRCYKRIVNPRRSVHTNQVFTKLALVSVGATLEEVSRKWPRAATEGPISARKETARILTN